MVVVIDTAGINLVIEQIDEWQAGRCSANDVAEFTLRLFGPNEDDVRAIANRAMTSWLARRNQDSIVARIAARDLNHPPCNDPEGEHR